MGRNKEIQDKIALEVKESTVDQWLQSPLLKGVIKETLRLYPVAPFITRVLPDNTELGGYTIPAGVCTSILISFVLIIKLIQNIIHLLVNLNKLELYF